MTTRIELDDLKRLLPASPQLIDVLPEQSYSKSHLPGAVNIPLKALDADSAAALDRARAVVVYCSDYL